MSDPTDASTWGMVGAALAAAASGAIGWFSGRRRREAVETADVAEHGVRAAEASAQTGVVTMLLQRVEALEARCRSMEHEIDAESRLRRQAEEHIAILQRALLAAGVPVPELPMFEGREPKVGEASA